MPVDDTVASKGLTHKASNRESNKANPTGASECFVIRRAELARRRSGSRVLR